MEGFYVVAVADDSNLLYVGSYVFYHSYGS